MARSYDIAILSQKVEQLEGSIKANDVIANPTGAATASLEKVQVDGTIYSIPTTSNDIAYDSDTTVTQAINEQDLNISDKFTLNTSTYSSLTGTVNAYYNRKTHKVYGTFGARATEAIPTTAEYFNIDSDYRPTETTNIPALVIITSNNVPSIYKVVIGTDGSIKQDLSGDSRGIYAYFEYYITGSSNRSTKKKSKKEE